MAVAADVPSVLRDPPWRKPRGAEAPAAAAELPAVEPKMKWQPGEREDIAGQPPGSMSEDAEDALLERLLEQLDLKKPPALASVRRLGDERLAELAEEISPQTTDYGLLQLLLSRVGEGFAAQAVELVVASPPQRGLFKAMLPVEASALAPLAAAEISRRRAHLDDAMTRPFSASTGEKWLARHPHAAAAGLWEAARDPEDKAHRSAASALRWVAVTGALTDVPQLDEELAPFRALAPLAEREGFEWLPVLVAAGLDRRALALLADHGLPEAVPYVARAAQGPAREEATEWLNTHRTIALRTLRELGTDDARVAIEILEGDADEHDPALHDVPEVIAPLPDWLDLTALPAPQVTGGDPLPADAVQALAEMLRFSSLDRPYAGIKLVNKACDAESLDRFAAALLQAWVDEGAEPRDRWTLDACGSIGGDTCAREISKFIRAWVFAARPPERGWDEEARRKITYEEGDRNWNYALTGCTVLATIGNDLALTVLDDLARGVNKPWFRRHARRSLGGVRVALGGLPELFDDAIVPDVGLDEEGSMHFSFGERTCKVWFDEQLIPRLVDQEGKRLRSFPRQRKADDADLYAAAKEKFNALRSDVKLLARQQIAQLELAMVYQRTWARAGFSERFVDHRLLRHLARCLLWRTADHTYFRVAEDCTFASMEDEELTLPADAEILLAHPAAMPTELRDAWLRVFTDYEILQPFEQLGREVHKLEFGAKDTSLPAFTGRNTTGRRLFVARRRGWGARDEGSEWLRELPGGGQACFRISPGFDFSSADAEYAVTKAWCTHELGRLSAIDYSELVRDLAYFTYVDEE